MVGEHNPAAGGAFQTETDSETESARVEEELFKKKATEKKLLNIARAVAQGTQRVSEALVSGDEDDQSSINETKARRETVRTAEYDIDSEQASEESEELLERQRANLARLEKLILGYEML